MFMEKAILQEGKSTSNGNTIQRASIPTSSISMMRPNIRRSDVYS